MGFLSFLNPANWGSSDSAQQEEVEITEETSEEQEETEDEGFTCEVCNKTLETERGLSIHQTRVHGEDENEEEEE